MTPEETALTPMWERVKQLEQIHQLDQAEIMRLRRQIEMLEEELEQKSALISGRSQAEIRQKTVRKIE